MQLTVESIGLEELGRALGSAHRFAYPYVRTELGRAGARIRKAFIKERMSGPPGIKGGEWKKQSKRHVRLYQKGNSLETLAQHLQLSRFLSLHETGGTLTARHKGRQALRIPIGDRRGLSFRGKKFDRGEKGYIRGLVYLRRKGGEPILAERQGDRLVPKYILKRQVTIKPKLGFRATIKRVWPDQFPRIAAALHRGIQESIRRTARTITSAVGRLAG